MQNAKKNLLTSASGFLEKFVFINLLLPSGLFNCDIKNECTLGNSVDQSEVVVLKIYSHIGHVIVQKNFGINLSYMFLLAE